jgi:hypothetical protein
MTGCSPEEMRKKENGRATTDYDNSNKREIFYFLLFFLLFSLPLRPWQRPANGLFPIARQ